MKPMRRVVSSSQPFYAPRAWPSGARDRHGTGMPDALPADQGFRSSRFSVRTHAVRHSVLLMCVPRSQKLMQSAIVSPPPPGWLGADSLGLGPEEVGVGDVADRSTPDAPPLDSVTGPGVGDSGATAGT
jgi:hypothetical protein